MVERRPDIFSFSIRAPYVVAVIPHEDPLNIDSVSKHGDPNCFSTIKGIINQMSNQANNFFKIAHSLKIKRKKLDEQREYFSQLYKNDSLRFV